MPQEDIHAFHRFHPGASASPAELHIEASFQVVWETPEDGRDGESIMQAFWGDSTHIIAVLFYSKNGNGACHNMDMFI